MAKMGHKMITLCSAAIGIIYTSGYIVTEPVKVESAQASVPALKQQVAHKGSSIASRTVKKTYQDGTYYGSGANHIGSVEVAVTIQNDKIKNVQITNCTTSYSQSYIDGLPQQVLDRQSANVDVVSGATRSTEDFQEAVQEALIKAKQSNTSYSTQDEGDSTGYAE
ncbi:FMN-binding protein [Ectobacillus panaciterrae]|uniref:FMN-binding protein n=1 Tax=Ectobacillus panaciterrae TaxID=363872 RepID=UPI0003F725D4|nr:FMN-binding protein [Ectobacillus panaciterrae]